MLHDSTGKHKKVRFTCFSAEAQDLPLEQAFKIFRQADIIPSTLTQKRAV